MSDRVRVGVIGAGVMGQKHLTYLAEHPGASIAAVAELSEELRKAAASTYSPARLYERGEDLIADKSVDAVVLALPAKPRFALGVAALEAGKHLFVEKPVARSVDEVDALLAAKVAGQTVAVASSRFTFLRSFAAVHERLAAAGGASRVYQIAHAGLKANPARPEKLPPNWRLSFDLNGGGIMSNWGCYDLNYLLALLDWEAEVTEVSANWRQVPREIDPWVAPGSDAETHVSAYLRLSAGGVIMLDRGEYLPLASSFNATSIVGDTWSIGCAIMAGEGDSFTQTRYHESGTRSEEFWSAKDDWEDLHRPVIHDFVDAIREKRDPATTLERARHVQAITDAIYQSAREKRSITL